MTAVTYCDLIKLGWRRSGSYLYKPDNRATCCPQLTISLNSKLFSPSKHQRQIINKFNKFVTEGAGTKEGTAGWGPVRADGTDEIGVNETVKAPPEKAKKGERKANTPIDLSEMLHAAESDHDIDYTFKHDFKVSLPYFINAQVVLTMSSMKAGVGTFFVYDGEICAVFEISNDHS